MNARVVHAEVCIFSEQTDRPTDRQTDRQTDKQTDRQRQTQTDTDRHRQTQTDTDRPRQTQTDIDIQTDRQTDRHKHTCIHTYIHTDTHTYIHTDTHTHTNASMHLHEPPGPTTNCRAAHCRSQLRLHAQRTKAKTVGSRNAGINMCSLIAWRGCFVCGAGPAAIP